MKKITLLVALCLAVVGVQAQDKIITTAGDTIACRIISVGSERITYEQATPDGYFGRSLELAQVASYLRTAPPPERTSQPSQRGNFTTTSAHIATRSAWHPSFQASVHGGYSYLPNGGILAIMREAYGDPALVPGYTQRLKHGFHLGAGAHVMLAKNVGVGA